MVKKTKSTAPGQYLGYSIQATRMLDHLIRSSHGDIVSLEVIADTATKKASGEVIAEESKSRISSGNPLSNAAEDLWKTLSNWVDAIRNGELNPDCTKFRICCTKARPGETVISFRDAKDSLSADKALDAAKARLGPSLNKFATNFYSAPIEIQRKIVISFEFETGAGSSISVIKKSLMDKYIPKDILDDVMTHLLGWVKARTDGAIESGLPATIANSEFRNEVETYSRKIDKRNILESFAKEPLQAEVEEHLRTRTYIRQLDLIDIEHDEQLRSVCNFLKAEFDRTNWAEKGYVNASSFDDLEKELIAAWGNYRIRANAAHSSLTDVGRGQIIYADCSLHTATVEGSKPSPHFINGSFHKLSDDRLIGWHPDYKKKLS